MPVASRPAPADDLGQSDTVPAPRPLSPGDLRDAGRRRALCSTTSTRPRPPRRASSCSTASRAAPSPSTCRGSSRLARPRGLAGVAPELPLLRADASPTRPWIPNRRPRLYHSGETTRPRSRPVAARPRRIPPSPLFAVGVSLGGNVLLKWLGENPGQRSVAAAAVISVPLRPRRGRRSTWRRGLGPRYTRAPSCDAEGEGGRPRARFPEAAARLDLPRARAREDVLRVRRRRDGAAPRVRGRGATTTRARARSASSAGSRRRRSASPPQDDPFLAARASWTRCGRAKSAAVRLRRHRAAEATSGFVGGGAGPRYWAERTVVDWLASRRPESPDRVLARPPGRARPL